MRPGHTWNTPPLSSENEKAEACYRRGISALVAGIADSEQWLTEAVTIEPAFFLAQIGVATTRAIGGWPYQAPEPTPGILRGERQHAEIVECAFANRHRRATDLRREHLLEYPGDLLIVWLPVRLTQVRLP